MDSGRRAQRVRLAVFFLLLIGSFAIFAVVVAGQNLWQRYDSYFVRYTNTSVSGLQAGGTVIYQGIAVGSIESIEIDPQNVENIVIELRVQNQTPIKTDVTAQIVPVGITGISQIQLSGGTREAATLEPGSFIPPADSTVTQVTESVQNVLKDLESVLNNIAGVLESIDRQSVGNILAEIERLVSDNQESISGVVAELERTARSLAEATQGIGGLVSSAGSITDDVELLVRRNGPEIDEAVDRLNDTLRLMNNFAFQINNDPSLLIIREEQ